MSTDLIDPKRVLLQGKFCIDFFYGPYPKMEAGFTKKKMNPHMASRSSYPYAVGGNRRCPKENKSKMQYSQQCKTRNMHQTDLPHSKRIVLTAYLWCSG